MKRFAILSLMALGTVTGWAQTAEKLDFKVYGRIRADLFYNSRQNNESADGLIYLYPKDHEYDSEGNDLNEVAQGSMYMLYTRMGVDIKGPDIGKAKATAKVEVDFRGSGTSYAVARIRHAYVNLDWGESDVLVGQTWHPMFGDVSPSVLNLSTGGPFQPLNRSPQVRYRYTSPSGIVGTAAAVWQMQFTSAGPDGKSQNYLKNSNVPELYASIDYKSGKFMAGIGGEMLTLCPRTKSVVDGHTYKVHERVTSFSGEVHAKYATSDWQVCGKSLLANNMTQLLTLGGFAVTSMDPYNGERTYTPFRHSITWLNFTCGKRWQAGVFVGYLKNLGTGKAITGETYGVGVDVDELSSASLQFSYNLPNWKLGAEVTSSTAWYGSNNLLNGKVVDTHSVNNMRLLIAAMYIF